MPDQGSRRYPPWLRPPSPNTRSQRSKTRLLSPSPSKGFPFRSSRRREKPARLRITAKSSRRSHFQKPSFSTKIASRDRKSTRLNSSHGYISYAVFCLKKKTTDITRLNSTHHQPPHRVSR